MTATIIALTMLAQPAPIPPPTVRTPPQAPPIVQPPPARQDWLTYSEGSAQAAKEGRPLVVFVGCPPRQVPGTLTCIATSLPGVAGPAVVIALPDGRGWLAWESTLPATATDAAILRVAGLEVRRATPVPFERTSAGELVLAGGIRIAEDDLAAGPWPKSLPKPKDAVRYRRAERTQRTFDRNITGRAFIESVPRGLLESKWNVPGGLDGVHGWTSTLYRGSGNRVREWRGPVDPGILYSEVTYQRSYDDGAWFADVLTNDRGQVFEVRYAEKCDGAWNRYIAFKNAAARPKGYVGVRQACSACHNMFPGSGTYGTAYIAGGDGVFSDPLTALE